jgi:D-alanine-D-alanine ligase
VKPVGEEGSDGIAKASFARTEEEAIARAKFVHESLETDALIEEYIEGRELYVSVLGNYRLTVFPPRELYFGTVPDDEPKFATAKAKWDYDYRKKWQIDNCEAKDLPDGTIKRLEHIARRVYRVLNLRGFARLDVRLSPDGQVFVIEVNPNPSLALLDDFAQSAAAAGVPYEELIQKILSLA